MALIPTSKPAIYHYDYWLITASFTLIAVGLVLLASASMGISDKQFHHPFHFLYRQLMFLVLGIGLGIFVLQIPLYFWEKISGYLLLASIFFLIVVIIPVVGREVNGSIRWLGIGAFGIQVSEFAKLAIVIYMAGFLVRRSDEVRHSFLGFIKPLLLLGIIAILLLLEPDFGAVVVITFTTLGMMYLAGARLWQFIMLLVVVGIAFGILAISSPYRLMRLTAFLNPWDKPFDSGYQLIQSLIAFGRGGVFGVGLGNGIQKLFYLPEAHTDFVFAVLAEEFGIIGQVVVLSLFAFFIGRIFYVGRLAQKHTLIFAEFLAYGLGLILGLQVIINVGVNTGLLPTKGLTLPLMSYGGSSILFSCLIIAILLRVYHEVKANAIFVPKVYYVGSSRPKTTTPTNTN